MPKPEPVAEVKSCKEVEYVDHSEQTSPEGWYCAPKENKPGDMQCLGIERFLIWLSAQQQRGETNM